MRGAPEASASWGPSRARPLRGGAGNVRGRSPGNGRGPLGSPPALGPGTWAGLAGVSGTELAILTLLKWPERMSS
jgi:hypothetical protein